jgi:signal transduction histidine kinase
MQPLAKFQERFRQVKQRHLDPASLQFRLTLEISLLSILARYHLEPLLLNDLVLEVVDMSKKLGERFSFREEATPTIHVDAKEDIEAMVDRDRLKQVLIN